MSRRPNCWTHTCGFGSGIASDARFLHQIGPHGPVMQREPAAGLSGAEPTLASIQGVRMIRV
jgi:hypothetical protein